MYPLPSEVIFNFHFNPILLYEKHLVAFFTWKKNNLVNWTDSEHLHSELW